MARKTTAEILANDYGKWNLLRDGKYFGLSEATGTPKVVQISPNPNDASPRVVCVGDLISFVVGVDRSDEYTADFKPFRPLPTGALDWVRTTANVALVQELSRSMYELDTDKMLFVFRAIAAGTVSIEFSYNYVAKNASTGEYEVKTTKTTAVTQLIKPNTGATANGEVGVGLRTVVVPFNKYQAGEAFKADFLFSNGPIDLTKLKVTTSTGLSHTGTPTASGAVATSQFVVNTDAEAGTVQTITAYYGGTAKMAKVTIYDSTISPIWGFSESGVAMSPAVAPAVAAALAGGAAAAAGPAVAALDGGAAATPAAASLDDGAEAAATPAASESKSSKKSKAVAD